MRWFSTAGEYAACRFVRTPEIVRGVAERRSYLFAQIFAVLSIVVGLSVPTAHAETIRSALTAAYQNNPELDAERARLRATDESVQRARSGWRPRLNGSANLGVTKTRNRSTGNEASRSGDLGILLSQPVFTGFRTYNAVNEAEAEVRAGRAQLRDVEGRVLVEVAQSYLNIVRDRELVRLSQRIVRILTRELASVKTRLGVGEVTRTDVHQAQSRRAEALVVLEESKGELRRSEASYQQLVGRSVGKLRVKRLLLGRLPVTLRAAIANARRESPLVERALYREQAARYAVSKERSELMPRIDLEAGFTRAYDSTEVSSRTDTAEVMGRLQVPLYQGGAVRARVRQVKHLHVSRLQEVEQARRQAVSDLRVAWATLQAAKRKLKSDHLRIRYVESALKGVRKEERVGQRTLLDVLNAEQEVFQARTSLVRNRRDRALAHYQVLRATGRLNSQFLALAKVQYDPEMHYKESKSKWLTISITDRSARGPRSRHERPSKLGRLGAWSVTSIRSAHTSSVRNRAATGSWRSTIKVSNGPADRRRRIARRR